MRWRRSRAAPRRSARSTVAIANNAGSPLLELAEAPVLLATPPEVIAGSTRMGAGTAQKIALNMLSTLAAIHLGHVHDGYDGQSLRRQHQAARRAARIVAAVAGCDEKAALAALEKTGGQVKPAILLARRCRRREDCGRIARQDRPTAAPGFVETWSSRGKRTLGIIPIARRHQKEPGTGQTGRL